MEGVARGIPSADTLPNLSMAESINIDQEAIVLILICLSY
jgi:hypothetical protein